MVQRTCIEESCEGPLYSNERCATHYGKWYYAENAEHIRERRRQARQGSQRERILAEKAAYRAKNRVELAAKQRAYYRSDPERAAASTKTPVARAAHARRKRTSRARYTEIEQERRAKKLQLAVDPGISVEALASRDGASCAYCGQGMTFERAERGAYAPSKATIDHVIPISRGGAHIWSNVCLSCWRCNLSKGNRLLTEWVSRPRAA